MKLRHTVKVNIADKKGNKQEILRSTSLKVPKRLLKLFFGDFQEMLVIVPGETVEGIVIQEIPKEEKGEKEK